ncbi:MAG: alkaline phosphatase family protein [Desulfobacterales bacterium]|nr:alkaline phosphatase family protein [Desulfobacterales bacterium]
MPDNIIDLPELRGKTYVFQDRAHAGKVLAGMKLNNRKNCTQWNTLIRLTILALFLAPCLVYPLAANALASSHSGMAVQIRADGIDDFARIDTDVYRGSSPSDSGLKTLARAQVKTIICLRKKVPYREEAEKLGLKIEHIPLSELEVPSRKAILRFLEITTDPDKKPVFFHCHNGKIGTGVMAAIYRIHVQGWPKDMVFAEMKEFGFKRSFSDLNDFVDNYYKNWLKKSSDSINKEEKSWVEAGNRLLEDGKEDKALLYYHSALQRDKNLTEARLGLVRLFLKQGNILKALSEIHQALIRAGTQEERIRVARITINVLAEASARNELPYYGFEVAEREWALLEMVGAEDKESLISLGELFQKGLHLSRALEAFERARNLGKPVKDLEGKVVRIRAVKSHAPRSEIGKRLGLMSQVNRGELAALLIQELRVDRLRVLQGSPTWRPTIEGLKTIQVVKDIADSPHRADIERVLALGIRGLEAFPDNIFRPTDPVRRAEFVVILEEVLTRATRDQTLPTRLLGKLPRFSDVKSGVWYQSAADLALDLGLFAPAPGEVPKFRSLDPITGLETLQAFRLLRKRLDTRARAIVLVVDALRAESIYNSIDEERLPNLSRLIRERGAIRFENCLSALPSVTLPNHTTIFTGVYPGRHGVPGNEWFDRTLDASEPFYRRTREYVKYGHEDDPGLGRAWSFGGIPVHDMDLSPEVRTIYEAFEEAETRRGRGALTAVVFDPVRRGADKVINPDIFDALISLDFLPFVDSFASIDASAMEKAVELIESDDPPELMGIWLSGLDGWSHANGPGPVGGKEDRQAIYIEKNIDPLIGDLIEALEDRGLLDETLIFLISDHGQADTIGEDKFAIDAEKVYLALAGSPYQPPLDEDGKLDENSTDFNVAVMANSNGNAALVSIRTPGVEWNQPPTQADLKAVAMLIIKEPYVSRIFFLGPKTPGNEPDVFMLSRKDNGSTLTRLDQESGERLLVRAIGLAGSGRSGDLLVEAKSPYYFAPWGSIYQGQHGRGERIEDHVPLLILNPPGERQCSARSVVDIADIAPTVAGTLGFLDYLVSDGKDLLDPPRIIISSHAEDQPVSAGKIISILGFVNDSVGINRVEFRIDEGKFNTASGHSFWEAQVKLSPGRHAITVRAMDETGLQSTIRFHLVAR